MNNEVYLLIAAYFFINAVIIFARHGYERWGHLPFSQAGYALLFYTINCIGVDVALVMYALTQWGGL